LTKKCSKRNI